MFYIMFSLRLLLVLLISFANAATLTSIDRGPILGLERPGTSLSLANLTSKSQLSTVYPIECFKQSHVVLEVAVAADCEVVINEIVLRMPNPMDLQTFGFDDSADFDLHLPENEKWFYGQCVIIVGSRDESKEEKFRFVDVAMSAQRIIQRCIVGSKSALGGSTDIGMDEDSGFYVVVGGLSPRPQAVKHPLSLNDAPHNPNINKQLDGRSSRALSPLFADFGRPRLSCIQPSMPAAVGKINLDDCATIAQTLLTDPNILDPQLFTTEPTGGIRVPFTKHEGGCYMMLNTHAQYPSSNAFSLLKVVYYASEIMHRCSLGGVAKVSSDGGFFVSVTGTDPRPAEIELENLLNSTTSFLELGRNISQIV